MALLGLVVGDACEEGEGLVQLAQLQPAWEATLLSNFPQEAVQACWEGSLKQLSGKASPSLFKSGKAAALFVGRVRWKLLRLKKSRRDKQQQQQKQDFSVHTKHSCPNLGGGS